MNALWTFCDETYGDKQDQDQWNRIDDIKKLLQNQKFLSIWMKTMTGSFIAQNIDNMYGMVTNKITYPREILKKTSSMISPQDRRISDYDVRPGHFQGNQILLQCHTIGNAQYQLNLRVFCTDDRNVCNRFDQKNPLVFIQTFVLQSPLRQQRKFIPGVPIIVGSLNQCNLKREYRFLEHKMGFLISSSENSTQAVIHIPGMQQMLKESREEYHRSSGIKDESHNIIVPKKCLKVCHKIILWF